MAITKTFINNEPAVLRSFLAGLGLFGSVTLEDATVTCRDAENHILMTAEKITSPTLRWTFQVYADAELAQTVTVSGNSAIMDYGYACANGGLIHCGYENSGSAQTHLAFAKTNQNRVAVIIAEGAAPTGNISAVAWGDAAPLARFSFTANSRNQTMLVPFATNAALSEVSFTPKAGFLPFGQYYNLQYGKILLDGVFCITNGYWAIQDEAQTA